MMDKGSLLWEFFVWACNLEVNNNCRSLTESFLCIAVYTPSINIHVYYISDCWFIIENWVDLYLRMILDCYRKSVVWFLTSSIFLFAQHYGIVFKFEYAIYWLSWLIFMEKFPLARSLTIRSFRNFSGEKLLNVSRSIADNHLAINALWSIPMNAIKFGINYIADNGC